MCKFIRLSRLCRFQQHTYSGVQILTIMQMRSATACPTFRLQLAQRVTIVQRLPQAHTCRSASAPSLRSMLAVYDDGFSYVPDDCATRRECMPAQHGRPPSQSHTKPDPFPKPARVHVLRLACTQTLLMYSCVRGRSRQHSRILLSPKMLVIL